MCALEPTGCRIGLYNQTQELVEVMEWAAGLALQELAAWASVAGWAVWV